MVFQRGFNHFFIVIFTQQNFLSTSFKINRIGNKFNTYSYISMIVLHPGATIHRCSLELILWKCPTIYRIQLQWSPILSNVTSQGLWNFLKQFFNKTPPDDCFYPSNDIYKSLEFLCSMLFRIRWNTNACHYNFSFCQN